MTVVDATTLMHGRRVKPRLLDLFCGASARPLPRPSGGNGAGVTCRCHSHDYLYGGLVDCPACGHRSFDLWCDACERRKCGYVAVRGVEQLVLSPAEAAETRRA